LFILVCFLAFPYLIGIVFYPFIYIRQKKEYPKLSKIALWLWIAFVIIILFAIIMEVTH